MSTPSKACSTGSPKPLWTAGLAVVAGVLTVAAYLAWLRWHDRDYYYDPAVGAAQGPYHLWQVVGLAVTLALFAVAGGWLRRPGWTTLVMTVVLVVVWSLDASYEPRPRLDANLWPVGAFFLSIGSVVGLGLAAILGRALRELADWLTHRRLGPD